MVRRSGWDINSYHVHTTTHSCSCCFFIFPLIEVISLSCNPPSGYPEPYKAGWERAKREK